MFCVQSHKGRVNLDDRLIALKGTAVLSSGQRYAFRDHDSISDTSIIGDSTGRAGNASAADRANLVRVAWDRGNGYRAAWS